MKKSPYLEKLKWNIIKLFLYLKSFPVVFYLVELWVFKINKS